MLGVADDLSSMTLINFGFYSYCFVLLVQQYILACLGFFNFLILSVLISLSILMIISENICHWIFLEPNFDLLEVSDRSFEIFVGTLVRFPHSDPSSWSVICVPMIFRVECASYASKVSNSISFRFITIPNSVLFKVILTFT